MTTDPRSAAIASVETAVAHLAEALEELDGMPAGNTASSGLLVRALDNYVTVADATLDLLLEALRDHPNPEVATWLAGLRHLGGMMQHTMGRLLHSASPADFPLLLEPIDLSKLMTRACAYYAPSAARKRLQIVCRTAGTTPPAWGDRVAVAVIAENLLSNAVKYSKPDGSILVQVAPGPGGIVCSVRDHGPGVEADLQARLARRSGRTTAAAAPSSGYGLSIAHDLVDRMGGLLWLDQDGALGACFSFRLPYPPAAAGTG